MWTLRTPKKPWNLIESLKENINSLLFYWIVNLPFSFNRKFIGGVFFSLNFSLQFLVFFRFAMNTSQPTMNAKLYWLKTIYVSLDLIICQMIKFQLFNRTISIMLGVWIFQFWFFVLIFELISCNWCSQVNCNRTKRMCNVLWLNKLINCIYIRTSSLMIKLGRRPGSSGGINDPRRLDGPELGANEPLRSLNGLFSRTTSIFGASTGALISGTLTAGTSYLISFHQILISVFMFCFFFIYLFQMPITMKTRAKSKH